MTNDWSALRAHYARFDPLIVTGPKNEWAIDPYAWDGSRMLFMTPIEQWIWSEIRDANAIFYPQYPVGRFFVDFANPVARVAIECDGAAFHTDKAKDAARDAILARIGWHVYRAPGWLCAQDSDPETGTLGGAGRFVREIVDRHGLCREGFDEWIRISLTGAPDRRGIGSTAQ